MMLDTAQYGWPQIRNFYRILASGIEQARYDWSDTSEISALRQQYAQRPVTFTQSRQYPQQKPIQNSNVRICVPYQTDECPQSGAHDGYMHICAYCYPITGMHFHHREKDCCRKAYQTKNSPQGEK